MDAYYAIVVKAVTVVNQFVKQVVIHHIQMMAIENFISVVAHAWNVIMAFMAVQLVIQEHISKEVNKWK